MDGLAVDPSGSLAFVAGARKIYLLEVENPQIPARELHEQTRRWKVGPLVTSPHTTQDAVLAFASGSDAIVWRVDGRGAKPSLETEMRQHTRKVTGISWDPLRSGCLATVALDGYVHGWDLRTPRRSHNPSHTAPHPPRALYIDDPLSDHGTYEGQLSKSR